MVGKKNYELNKVEQVWSIKGILEKAVKEVGTKNAFRYKKGEEVIDITYEEFQKDTIYYLITSVNFKKVQVSMLAMYTSIVVLFFNYGYYYLHDVSEFYPNTRYKIIFSPYYSILNPKIDEQRERFIENYRKVSFMF